MKKIIAEIIWKVWFNFRKILKKKFMFQKCPQSFANVSRIFKIFSKNGTDIALFDQKLKVKNNLVYDRGPSRASRITSNRYSFSQPFSNLGFFRPIVKQTRVNANNNGPSAVLFILFRSNQSFLLFARTRYLWLKHVSNCRKDKFGIKF